MGGNWVGSTLQYAGAPVRPCSGANADDTRRRPREIQRRVQPRQAEGGGYNREGPEPVEADRHAQRPFGVALILSRRFTVAPLEVYTQLTGFLDDAVAGALGLALALATLAVDRLLSMGAER